MIETQFKSCIIAKKYRIKEDLHCNGKKQIYLIRRSNCLYDYISSAAYFKGEPCNMQALHSVLNMPEYALTEF